MPKKKSSEYDEAIVDLFTALRVVHSINEWQEMNMAIMPDDEEDGMELIIFIQDDESMSVQVPHPLGSRFAQNFIQYLEMVSDEEDDEEDEAWFTDQN